MTAAARRAARLLSLSGAAGSTSPTITLDPDATGGEGALGGGATGGIARFIIDDSAIPAGTPLPTGFTRRTGALTLTADAYPAAGQGGIFASGTNGQIVLSIVTGQPGAAVTIGGDLIASSTVKAGAGVPASAPGITLTTGGQPFTVPGNATFTSLSDIVFMHAPSAPLAVQGAFVATTPGKVTGTGPINVTGASTVTGNGGITLEYLSSGGTSDFSATGGDIAVTNDLRSVGLVTANGKSIHLKSLAGLAFGVLGATGGDIVIDLAGNGQFNSAVSATGGFDVATGGNASFNATVDVQGDILGDIEGLASISGLVNGRTINFTSTDIAIGTGATIGSFQRTTDIVLQSQSDVAAMSVGGAGAGSGYSLSNTEFGRLRASQAIEIDHSGNGTLQLDTLNASALPGGTAR